MYRKKLQEWLTVSSVNTTVHGMPGLKGPTTERKKERVDLLNDGKLYSFKR